jgi:ARG and Rhodanese-Phosphatase-superfamily-associated Protein domain
MQTKPAPSTSLPFELGEPRSFAGLTLVPLYPTAEPRAEYVGLDEAAAGGLAVTEVNEAGIVESLLVANPLDTIVLLFEGEELVERSVRVKGSPEKSVTIDDLAASGTFQGKGAGEIPEGPTADAEGCLGRLGFESFHAPQLIAHAVRVKVDRETGVVRVLQVAAAHDSSGAVANAIARVVGARVRALPMTPERVWQTGQGAEGGA